MGAKKAGAKKAKLTLGALASIATIGGVVWTIDHGMKEDDRKEAAEAARVHHARITFGTAVDQHGAVLSVANRQVAIDPVPPLNAPRYVTVNIDDPPCTPSAELEVEHNDIRLTLARCVVPNGATGTLTWTDPSPTGKAD
jgi:hypothetical protein